jgi:hypothetical protein
MGDMAVLAYLGLLFFVLTPGVLLSLPSGGSKLIVAATHAVVFVVAWYFLSWYFLVGDGEEAFYAKAWSPPPVPKWNGKPNIKF